MAKTSTYSVAPGDNVGFTVNAAISHPGPLSVWMSKAPDGTAADAYDGSGDWFKVYELTYTDITSAGIQWASYPSGTSGLTNFTIDIPTDLPAGDYLMRAEHIALHAAEEVGGAQFYIGCAQLSVTGSGAGAPTPVTSIPGQYTGEESGLVINIYYPIPTNYTAPGEVTWPGACDSHEANLEGQTYLGMCVSEDGTDSEGTSSGTTSAAASAAATTSAVAVAAEATASSSSSSSAAAVATTSSAAVTSAAASSTAAAQTTSSAKSSSTSAAPAASSSAASKCNKRKKRATAKKAL